MESDISFASATELRQKIAANDVSIVELTELFYQRIERLNPQLNAYLSLCPDQALAAAQQAQEAVQRGDSLGLLHGIPISIKDLEVTQGIPTTMGSAIFRDRVPEVFRGAGLAKLRRVGLAQDNSAGSSHPLHYHRVNLRN